MESESNCLEAESMLWTQSPRVGARFNALDPESMLGSQSQRSGARVLVVEPEAMWRSQIFVISHLILASAPVLLGLTQTFLDRQVKWTIFNLFYSLIFLWEHSIMLKSQGWGGSHSLCGGARVYTVSKKNSHFAWLKPYKQEFFFGTLCMCGGP